jgi:hypothetical protein
MREGSEEKISNWSKQARSANERGEGSGEERTRSDQIIRNVDALSSRSRRRGSSSSSTSRRSSRSTTGSTIRVSSSSGRLTVGRSVAARGGSVLVLEEDVADVVNGDVDGVGDSRDGEDSLTRVREGREEDEWRGREGRATSGRKEGKGAREEWGGGKEVIESQRLLIIYGRQGQKAKWKRTSVEPGSMASEAFSLAPDASWISLILLPPLPMTVPILELGMMNLIVTARDPGTEATSNGSSLIRRTMRPNAYGRVSRRSIVSSLAPFFLNAFIQRSTPGQEEMKDGRGRGKEGQGVP